LTTNVFPCQGEKGCGFPATSSRLLAKRFATASAVTAGEAGALVPERFDPV
jgi:hypothetical protein